MTLAINRLDHQREATLNQLKKGRPSLNTIDMSTHEDFSPHESGSGDKDARTRKVCVRLSIIVGVAYIKRRRTRRTKR